VAAAYGSSESYSGYLTGKEDVTGARTTECTGAPPLAGYQVHGGIFV